MSQTVFNLQSRPEYMVEMAMFNVQRAITLKVGKSELRFICSASSLIVLYICVKFPENTSNGFQLTEWTLHGRNGYIQCSKGNNSKSRQPELWFMCSACLMVLYICVKFGDNIPDSIRVMERTQMMEALTDELTDGQMDTQNFGRYNIIPLPLFVTGHKKCWS